MRATNEMQILVIESRIDEDVHVGTIDFLPKKDEYILLPSTSGNKDYLVDKVIYVLKENSILVFVKEAELNVTEVISNIKFK